MKRDFESRLKGLEDQLNVQSKDEEVTVISFGERNCDCKTTQECMRRGHCIFIDVSEADLDEGLRKELEILKSQGRIFKMPR